MYTILLFQVLSTFTAAGLFIYFQLYLFVRYYEITKIIRAINKLMFLGILIIKIFDLNLAHGFFSAALSWRSLSCLLLLLFVTTSLTIMLFSYYLYVSFYLYAL